MVRLLLERTLLQDYARRTRSKFATFAAWDMIIIIFFMIMMNGHENGAVGVGGIVVFVVH